MGKQEAKFKARTKEVAKTEIPVFVIFYVAGVGTDGVPDWCNNGYGVSSFIEFKHCIGTSFETKDNQELMCCRLAAASRCRYVIFHEQKTTKRICIIDPRHVIGKKGRLSEMVIESQCVGYDYKWLCQWIKAWHRG